MTEPENKKSAGWEDLIFSTIEKLASGSSKIKDPSAAVDWLKNLREDVIEKVKEEVSSKISMLDLSLLSKKIGDHLAENYRLKLEAKIEWEPKEKKFKKSEDDSTPKN